MAKNNVTVCYGEMKRNMCNYALKDLATIWPFDSYYANKFDLAVDPKAVLCMHEFLTTFPND